MAERKTQLPGPDEYGHAAGSDNGQFPALSWSLRSGVSDRDILWAIWDKLLELEAAIEKKS